MAPATRSSCCLCSCCGCFVSKILCRFSRWETGNIKKEYMVRTTTCMYVRVQRVQGLDRQAARTAMLTLASCVLLLPLPLLLCCGRRTAAAVDVVHQSLTLSSGAMLRESSFCWTKPLTFRVFVLTFLLC